MIVFLVSCILSFLIYDLFDFCFAMLAFYTTYIFGMTMVKNAIMALLTGQLIPLDFFPGTVQKVFSFLPFASMTYTPVIIYLGKYSADKILLALTKQIMWVIILYIFGELVWRKVTKRLVVLGG